MKPAIFILAAAVIAFAAGIYLGSGMYTPAVAENIKQFTGGSYQGVDNHGFIPVNATIDGVSVILRAECREISFDVTEDQAYSIQRGIEGSTGARPLTHDILKDLMDNYNITILNARIEYFGNEIYYARLIVQQGNKVLDMDVRPSDIIALTKRTGSVLYINQTMLEEKGSKVC